MTMVMRGLLAAVAAAIGCLTLGGPGALAAVPANDDFGAASVVTGGVIYEQPFVKEGVPGVEYRYGVELSGSNVEATKESGEPEHAGDPGGASVWYSWTAPASGTAYVYPCCGFDFLVGVYTGDALGALVPIATTPGPPGTAVATPVEVGVTYRIAIDGARDESSGAAFTSDFAFRISMEVPRPVDPGEGPWVTYPIAMPPPVTWQEPDRWSPQTTLTRSTKKSVPPILAFRFAASEPATFRCRFDGRPLGGCTSPMSLRNLKPGRHRFEVFAVDAAGNADPTPAVARFNVPNLKPNESTAKDKR